MAQALVVALFHQVLLYHPLVALPSLQREAEHQEALPHAHRRVFHRVLKRASSRCFLPLVRVDVAVAVAVPP